jgi:hypothetical protein
LLEEAQFFQVVGLVQLIVCNDRNVSFFLLSQPYLHSVALPFCQFAVFAGQLEEIDGQNLAECIDSRQNEVQPCVLLNFLLFLVEETEMPE